MPYSFPPPLLPGTTYSLFPCVLGLECEILFSSIQPLTPRATPLLSECTQTAASTGLLSQLWSPPLARGFVSSVRHRSSRCCRATFRCSAVSIEGRTLTPPYISLGPLTFAHELPTSLESSYPGPRPSVGWIEFITLCAVLVPSSPCTPDPCGLWRTCTCPLVRGCQALQSISHIHGASRDPICIVSASLSSILDRRSCHIAGSDASLSWRLRSLPRTDRNSVSCPTVRRLGQKSQVDPHQRARSGRSPERALKSAKFWGAQSFSSTKHFSALRCARKQFIPPLVHQLELRVYARDTTYYC